MDGNIFDLCLILLLASGLVLLPLARFSRNNSRLLPPGKRVGGSYWGVYNGTPTSEPENRRYFTVKPPSSTDGMVSGSNVYASGKPIKSLRK